MGARLCGLPPVLAAQCYLWCYLQYAHDPVCEQRTAHDEAEAEGGVDEPPQHLANHPPHAWPEVGLGLGLGLGVA